MSKPGYLPDENVSDSFLISQLQQIIATCDRDLAKDTIKTRDSYEQIKAFHYDAMKIAIEGWLTK